ncbi:MAG: zinc-binding alcohol dehydrogenase [Clostridia bacterium]|nr:zinc-binding alcohol dehydrogenase [Clostridia bacterium]
MKSKTVVFTKPMTAETLMQDTRPVGENDVVVKMEYTVISGGTERAVIMNNENTGGVFPTSLGYCGVGCVIQTGNSVTKVSDGDRVLVYHGIHTEYNVVDESQVTKVDDDSIDSLEAAFVVIASMGLGGVRKLELELGESAMVMGLGLLGIFAVQFLRQSGANPLIAADPNPDRRKLALSLGADFALDPTEDDFAEKVREITK